MADDEDLRINSINRFSKRSPRLALEEHSHCEVPAGCGGVILRWRDPREGRSVVLQVAGGGRVTVTLDGAAVDATYLTLSFGEHELVCRVEPEVEAPFLCALVEGEDVVLVATRADGSWTDGAGTALAADPTPLDQADQKFRWRLTRTERLGATPLQLGPDGVARTRFRVTP